MKPARCRIILFSYWCPEIDDWQHCPAVITRVIDERTVNLHLMEDYDNHVVKGELSKPMQREVPFIAKAPSQGERLPDMNSDSYWSWPERVE